MDFNPLDYPLAWKQPLYLSEPSAWVGHIPFGMALMEMARPRVLVELGTLMGDSYFAFCEGVSMAKLPTRCTAVDTWRGDAHAGELNPAALQQLRAFHDPRYASFSTLMQSDFDSAATTFADRSIDLLHIDGLHTYEVVRHDYETWRPKLSEQAVILFHDVAVRDRGFGVWKLWDELTQQFPGFAFDHSHGLGILAVGAEPPLGVSSFLAAAREQPDRIREYFAALGHRALLLRMTRMCLGAMDWQRQEIDRWRQSKGLPTRDGPLPSSTKFSAIRSLMDDFAEMLRIST
jgi:O-antigen biosynthesis protein